MSNDFKTTRILEQLLEEEMLNAIENHDWRRYDIALLKYADVRGQALKQIMTTPYVHEDFEENKPKICEHYATKARRTTDNGGIF